jgi:hypothetical protein
MKKKMGTCICCGCEPCCREEVKLQVMQQEKITYQLRGQSSFTTSTFPNIKQFIDTLCDNQPVFRQTKNRIITLGDFESLKVGEIKYV